MKKQPQTSEIEVEFEAKKYSVEYSVSGKSIVVHVWLGDERLGPLSTHVGAGGATHEARRLARELLTAAKKRGEL
jgi:hypothetical protein